MSKDDYDVLAFKVLLYLYAIFKGKQVFDINIFKKAVTNIDDGYLNRILSMMKDEKLIQGLAFQKVWGNEKIIINDLSDMSITSDGIHYLLENKRMTKVKKLLLNQTGTIGSLIKMIF
ncbi:hypothetical protein J2Z60_000167 [Lactobacillus colini]|uniref:YjcQ protein n=1 Tax=Lactobacillus colini TaxID=1819254 RepID=A0ABS4MBH2_9LACO|nr:YjcQ family protein [Lactobacillus colini]MBP2057005.1 hypothetical protein [Lactobacillus colini]